MATSSPSSTARRSREEPLSRDRHGWLLIYKRLERDVFHMPHGPAVGTMHVEIEAAELPLMLKGAACGDGPAGRHL
ncbi:IS66 family insertion sequence element accessory protein TnpB [Vulgatibacter incomptus]|nr:IS66 family insertion sequence element accessory protein TnpB [Vulgatibacter incomptus]